MLWWLLAVLFFAMQGAGQGAVRLAQGVRSSCWWCLCSGVVRVLLRVLFGVRVLLDVRVLFDVLKAWVVAAGASLAMQAGSGQDAGQGAVKAEGAF